MLRSAVFGTRDTGLPPALATTAVTGVLTGVSEQAIAVHSDDGERVLRISAATRTWLGAATTPTALRPGDEVIVRRRPTATAASVPASGAPATAERIWARIGRVTGTIVEAAGRELLVDTGQPGIPPERVVIAAPSLRQVQVRFPWLAPGYPIDVIGTRHRDYLLAVVPATAQPPRPFGHLPAPPLAGERPGAPVIGTAVWHEPGPAQPPGLLGLAYPALDPESAGGPAPAPGACVQLPYLSLGSVARIRNECAGRAAVLPVTGWDASSCMFCDRCVQCGTSPRGRVADLTIAAFVELGGDLEKGCFNATLTLVD